MGDPSFLRLVPDSSANVPIDWSKVPEASKKYFIKGWCHSFNHPEVKALPATIGEFAKMLDESKFFGFLEPNRCKLLLDISEFGLTEPSPSDVLGLPVGPHFYMKYLSEIWFVLFEPGRRDGIIGIGPKIPYVMDDSDEEDYDIVEEKQFARDKKIAEDYEPKLCEEVSRIGTLGALANKNIAGWESHTLESSLEEAQFCEAILTLPHDHPAQRAMMRNALSQLRG